MDSRRSRRSRNSPDDPPTNSHDDRRNASRTATSDGDENNPLQCMRERSRAVAEREASRLARPAQPLESRTLGHASKVGDIIQIVNFGSTLETAFKLK